MGPKRVGSADILNAEDRRPISPPVSSSTNSVDVEAVRRRAVEQYQSTLDCRRIVDAILLDVDDEIVRTHVDYMSVPWTVQSVVTDLFEALHVAFAEREEPLDDDRWDDASYADVVERLVELNPVPSDPWSRGLMNKRKPIPLPQLPSALAQQGVSSGNPLSASLSASRAAAAAALNSTTSGARVPRKEVVKPVAPVLNNSMTELIERPQSAASSTQRSVLGGPSIAPRLKALPKSGGPGGKESGRSTALDSVRSDSDSGIATTASPGHSPQKGASPSRRAGAGAASSHADAKSTAASRMQMEQQGQYTEEELAILKQQKETMQRMNQLRRIAEKVEHQLNDIKAHHGGFVIDGSTHSVIPVHSVDPATLPARQEPKVTLEKGETGTGGSKKAAAAAAAAAAAGTPDLSAIQRGGTPGLSEGTASPPKRGTSTPASLLLLQQQQLAKQQRVDVTQFYTQEAQVQPMIQELAPAAGVATKEGETVRKCELKLPKSRMSRSDFTKVVQTQQSSASLSAGSAEGASDATAGAAGKKDGSGSNPDAPVSPPLSSVRRQSIAKMRSAAAVNNNTTGADSNPIALTSPTSGGVVQQSTASAAAHIMETSLDAPMSRAVTPQPTATRPSHTKHQSPVRTAGHRSDSAARRSAARNAVSQLVAETKRNASRRIKVPHIQSADISRVEADTSRDFLESLEMGDFEPLGYVHQDDL